MNREGVNNLIDQIQELTAEKSKLCKLLLEHRDWLRQALHHLGNTLDAYNATSLDMGPNQAITEAQAFHNAMDGF